MKSSTSSLRHLTFTALMTAILAVCAWISVPAPVPFTLQTLGVFLAVGLLGGRWGSMSVLVYLLLGLAGAPVFSGFTGGIGAFMGARGGYLIGMLSAALVMWGMERLFGTSTPAMAAAMGIGLAVCDTIGTVWFAVVYAGAGKAMGVWTALTMCVLPYVIPDAAKIALALYLCKRLRHRHRP